MAQTRVVLPLQFTPVRLDVSHFDTGVMRRAMMSLSYRNAVMWSLLGLAVLMLALVFGPLPALAVTDWDDFDDGQNDAARYDNSWKNPDAVLYEVTEDMYLRDAAGNFVSSPVAGGSRSAVAQLTGWATVGT